MLRVALGLGALLAAAVGAILGLTSGDYPPEAAKHVELTAPGPFQPPKGAPAQSPAVRTVVVMLFDGLAPAMLDGVDTPTLDRMRREGAWTHNMVPPFPSISLIGGTTISTGCWPAHHGVVTNRFFDPQRGFYDHSRDADWLTGCEHLHQAAERQGVPSAALGWYGAVSASRGQQARDVVWEATWPEFPTDLERAQQVVELLQRPPGERPQLVLAYFRGPDSAGHFQGMDSPEVRTAVADTDRAIGLVLAAVEQLGARRGHDDGELHHLVAGRLGEGGVLDAREILPTRRCLSGGGEQHRGRQRGGQQEFHAGSFRRRFVRRPAAG